MKHRIVKLFILSLSSFSLLTSQSHAGKIEDIFNPAEEYGFDDSNRVSAQDLQKMRGGLRVAGLDFSFSVVSVNLFNGQALNITTLSTDEIAAANGAQNLAQILASKGIGNVNIPVPTNPNANNPNTTPSDLIPESPPVNNNSVLPTPPAGEMLAQNVTVNDVLINSVVVNSVISENAIINTIQNSIDNAILQQVNHVDLNVSGVSNVVQNAYTNQHYNFQAVQGLY